MAIEEIIADSIEQAKDHLYKTLGPDAIILEQQILPDSKILVKASKKNQTTLDIQSISNILEYHSFLPQTKEVFLTYAKHYFNKTGVDNHHYLLQQACQRLLNFEDFLQTGNKLKLFTGISGSGKSTGIAKIATKIKMQQQTCCIVSTDWKKAGANLGLEAFAKILGVDFYFCQDARSLYNLLKSIKNKYEIILVDTPGVNPFDTQEVNNLTEFTQVEKFDTILISDSGRNTQEAVEFGSMFYNLGARYLLATRFDLTHRIGSVISLANQFQFGICYGSVSDSIAHGLKQIDSQILAKILVG